MKHKVRQGCDGSAPAYAVPAPGLKTTPSSAATAFPNAACRRDRRSRNSVHASVNAMSGREVATYVQNCGDSTKRCGSAVGDAAATYWIRFEEKTVFDRAFCEPRLRTGRDGMIWIHLRLRGRQGGRP